MTNYSATGINIQHAMNLLNLLVKMAHVFPNFVNGAMMLSIVNPMERMNDFVMY
jgi:hypothetical protein